MATLSVLQSRLAEAETALHNVLLGKGVAEFRDSNGELVRYSKTDVRKLEAYIANLQLDIQAIETGVPRITGPMRIFF